MEYIPVEKDSIPYEFEITIASETFKMGINYNMEYDFFTVDLQRGEEVLASGEKLVYGSPLFYTYADSRFPKFAIIPFDIAGNEDTITYDNLGETVFLYIFTEEDLVDG